MNLNELKLAYFKRRSQIVVFDHDGIVLESCNTLSSISNGINLFEEIPFMQGLQHEIAKLRIGEPVIYNCIHTSVFDYQSFFDFIIRKVEDGDDVKWVWLIYDFHEQYENILELQQQRNVSHLQKTSLQKVNKNLVEEIETLERINEGLKTSGSSNILIKSDNQLINVDMKDVLFFEAFGDYVKIHTSKQVHVNYNRIKNIETKLPEDQFVRVHRSYIVRIDKIENIEQSSLQIGDKIIPIGQSFKSSLLDRLEQL
ncbi:MAG: LytTR family transcriptional regulator [Cyclobacteriaceae bacterium]|nr:LytTR family transcriptional regulator [Cyclobacteriaceae bacterium HetDA_MAG_MS6]